MSTQVIVMEDSHLRVIEQQFKVRVRTGCKTCRTRRVKCDEAKPHCSRCINAGRKCGGYDGHKLSPAAAAASQRNSSFLVIPQHARPKKARSSSALASPPPSQGMSVFPLLPNPSPMPYLDPAEFRSFDFFCKQTLRQSLSMFDSDSTFWNERVLQISHEEPAIRYGILSMGALHERCLGDDTTLPNSDKDFYAREKYSKALASSNRLLARESKDPAHLERVLIACLIFVCCENLVGNFALSAMHLQNGRRILKEHWAAQADRKTSRCPHAVFDGSTSWDDCKLSGMFSLLDLQALSLSDDSATYDFERNLPPVRPRIPEAFPCLPPARDALSAIYRVVNWELDRRGGNNPAGIHIKQEDTSEDLGDLLESWIQAFEPLEKRLLSDPTIDGNTRTSLTLVRMWQRTLQATCRNFAVQSSSPPPGLLDLDATRSLYDWSHSTHLYAQIVDLAASLPLYSLDPAHHPGATPNPSPVPGIAYCRTSSPSSPPSSSSSSTSSSSCSPPPTLPIALTRTPTILAIPSLSTQCPLFQAICHSRSPLLRRRALALLLRRRIREGVWDSLSCARVAAEIVKHEEGLHPDYDLCDAVWRADVSGESMEVLCGEEMEVPVERLVVGVFTRLRPERGSISVRLRGVDGMTGPERDVPVGRW